MILIEQKKLLIEFIQEDVRIVIGHYTSGMMLAAYDKMKNKDILYLGPTISADGLSKIDDNFIRFIASTKEQAQVINQVANDLGQKKFLVIVDDKNIGFNEMFKNFQEMLGENGGEVIGQCGYTELNEQSIGEIKNLILVNTEADGIFIISNGSDTATITGNQKTGNSYRYL